MKFKLFLLFCVLTFVACGSDNDVSEPEPDPVIEDPIDPVDPEPAEWKLIFEENFDVDLSKWDVWEGGAYNEEIQLYRPSQLEVVDGFLTINTKREAVVGNTNPNDTIKKSFEYLSGRLETKTKFGPTDVDGKKELRIMARLKLPKGNGMWPAFWSFGDPWPTQGEIDILEARGNNPKSFQSNIFYGNVAGQVLTSETEKVHNLDVDLTEDFHVYELIWKRTTLEILFDDKPLHTYNANDKNYITSMFAKEQQVVLNLAVGGVFFSDDNSANYADAASMEVDWVKVYER